MLIGLSFQRRRVRIGDIQRPLVRIISRQSQHILLHRLYAQASRKIYSLYIDLTEIDHAPDKQILGRYSHYLICHPVGISIHCSRNIRKPVGYTLAVCQPDIELTGIFRFQPNVPCLSVIQIIETRQAENIFIEKTNTKIFGSKRLKRYAGIWGQFPMPSGTITFGYILINHCRQQRSRKRHPLIDVLARQRGEPRIAYRLGKIFQVAVHAVNTSVGRKRKRKTIQRTEKYGCRKIILLLEITVFTLSGSSFIIRVQIMLVHPVPLTRCLKGPLTVELFLILALDKHILVP